jgi:uncharacterized protein YciI
MLTHGAGTADDAPKTEVQAMFFEERVAEMMRKMLRKKLYVLMSKPVVPPDRLKPFLMAHLDYMIGLEKRGVLFASGPLADGEGPPSGHGLTVLRAASAGEARAVAEADPFFVNGLRTFELKEWTVNEGSLSLRVNFSDQSVEVA